MTKSKLQNYKILYLLQIFQNVIYIHIIILYINYMRLNKIHNFQILLFYNNQTKLYRNIR